MKNSNNIPVEHIMGGGLVLAVALAAGNSAMDSWNDFSRDWNATSKPTDNVGSVGVEELDPFSGDGAIFLAMQNAYSKALYHACEDYAEVGDADRESFMNLEMGDGIYRDESHTDYSYRAYIGGTTYDNLGKVECLRDEVDLLNMSESSCTFAVGEADQDKALWGPVTSVRFDFNCNNSIFENN